MRTKSTGGFTLIELLIVIAIIGILAAVLIPNLLSARTRAFDTAAQSCARSLATAQEIHAIDNDGTYGADQTVLDQDMISGCSATGLVVDDSGDFEDDTAGWQVGHTSGSQIYTVAAGHLEGNPGTITP